MAGSVKNNVTRLRPLHRMGAVSPEMVAAAVGAAQGASGQGSGMPSLPTMSQPGGGVSVPVTTQVTTAVSPVFNISAGNSGGGVSQSGTTSQSATPSSANITGQPGMPGSAPGMLGAPGMTDYALTPAAYPTDGSFVSDSSMPTGSAYNQSPRGGLNMKMILIFGGLALGAWLLLSPKGKQQTDIVVRRLSGKRSSKKRAKRANAKT